MQPLPMPQGAWKPSARATQTERVSMIVGRDLEVGKLVAHYVDCRILDVPVNVETVLAEASSPEVAEEAASLILVADMLLETV